MGKAKRLNEEYQNKQRKEEETRLAEKTSKSKTIKLVISIAVLAVILAVIASMSVYGVKALENDGFFLRRTTAAKSEHFKVSGTMMSYYYYVQYYGVIDNYSDYLSYYGFDSSVDARDQEYYTGYTWYEYFLDMTVESVEDMLVFAEVSYAEDYTLTGEDKKSIEAIVDQLRGYADENSISLDDYISEIYGAKVNEKDLRKALEIAYLANASNNNLADSVEATEEDAQAFFTENKKLYENRDYRYLAVDSEEKAKSLAACRTEADFIALMVEYVTNTYKEAGKEIKDADIAEISGQGTLYEGYTYAEGDELSAWLFAEGRSALDTTVIAAGDGTYTAYMAIGDAYIEDYITKTFRHIMFSYANYEEAEALVKAEECLLKWKEEGGGEELFISFAEEYSEDSDTYLSGGLYENVLKGFTPESLMDWCYEGGRAPGDCSVVESDIGCHIMYFVGDGLPVYIVSAKNDLENERYTDAYNAYKEEYTVTINEKALNKISTAEGIGY